MERLDSADARGAGRARLGEDGAAVVGHVVGHGAVHELACGDGRPEQRRRKRIFGHENYLQHEQIYTTRHSPKSPNAEGYTYFLKDMRTRKSPPEDASLAATLGGGGRVPGRVQRHRTVQGAHTCRMLH